MDFKVFDSKWQKKWKKAKMFEANVSKGKKFFITFPYPYVNGPPHVGHGYSAFRTDVYARYKRQQGFNVLFPQGFHATGEPIIGVVKRLNNGDESQIQAMHGYGATEKDIEGFKKDPKNLVHFFIKKWIATLEAAGMSIDWRRKFVTTTLTPTYSRFIEWQYNTLKEKGFVTQGTHPVVWCPKDLSPTGDHDRLIGEGESPVDYVLLKFTYLGYILPAATLRPETIYGVTNMWLNPDTHYVEADVDGERWIISNEAAQKLKDQMKVEIISDFDVKELFGKRCIDPVSNREIPILPSKFVGGDTATGVVMSVPAHAPYDWAALMELMDKDELQLYNTQRTDIEPVSVIEVEGFGELPAVELCEQMGIKDLSDTKKLDEATSLLYKKEFHTGTVKNSGQYTGTKVNESKEKLTLDFIEKGVANVMWEVGEVVCRCNTRCHVKILENQWFLKFSDEEWKKDVRTNLSRMTIYPEEARNNFENTIDWLRDKACARKSGLGTPIPWDREWIVETLSDSTIYMAYYTLARIINEKKVKPEKLTDEVFDFIFTGKGDTKKVAKASKLKLSILRDLRKEFEYFYPVDMRSSGKDLVQNHLTFFMFHHIALFPRAKWPNGISVNGYVNVEGEKMSKSKGNIIPLKSLLEQHGADMVRINMVGSSQGIDDADWREESVKAYRNRYDTLFQLSTDWKKAKKTKMENIDLFMQGKLQKIIESTTKSMESMMFRDAVQSALFEATSDLKWYLRRTGNLKNANKKVIKEYTGVIVKLLTPFTPHVCEEMWSNLGNKKMISGWPKWDSTRLSNEAELGEDMLKKTLNDIEDLQRIVKMKPKKIILFIAEDWKFRVYQKVLRNKDQNMNTITKEIMSSGAYGKATVSFIQSLYKKLNELKPVMTKSMQLILLKEAKEFLQRETNTKIEIIDADKTTNQKAKVASPNKFGIFME